MVFQLHIPSFPLSRYIESFFYFKGFNPIHSLDRFLPDGHVNIVFELTDNPQHIYDNDTLKPIQACRNVWFSGIRTKCITIPSGRDSELFVITFHKGKAYPFVEMPLDELTDSVVDAELVLTDEIINMRDRLLSIRSIDRKFQYAEGYLLRHFGKKLEGNPFIDFAVDRILPNPHHAAIASIADKVGYSQKHLISLFRENIGVTPKAFLKIIRFQKAVLDIEQSNDISWTAIAHESGYYDQAHFIHDFRNFSGFTPEQYLKVKNDALNYVPVG